jgi:hypothetical protein
MRRATILLFEFFNASTWYHSPKCNKPENVTLETVIFANLLRDQALQSFYFNISFEFRQL